jgi:hypothetical protein
VRSHRFRNDLISANRTRCPEEIPAPAETERVGITDKNQFTEKSLRNQLLPL